MAVLPVTGYSFLALLALFSACTETSADDFPPVIAPSEDAVREHKVLPAAKADTWEDGRCLQVSDKQHIHLLKFNSGFNFTVCENDPRDWVTPPPEAVLVRLSGGTESSGYIEVYHKGVWGTVCDDYFTLQAAHVVCRDLGFQNALTFDENSSVWESDGIIWLDDVTCTGTEHSLFDCKHAPVGEHNCEHHEDVYVTCSIIRLTDGTGPAGTSGLLEVYHNRKWGAVCSNGFTVQAAKVVCRQLGLHVGARFKSLVGLGNSSANILLDDISCSGTETSLFDCQHGPLEVHNCDQQKQVKVTCMLVRLSGGTDSSGYVEVYYKGEWGTVCDDDFTLQAAHVVCRDLGFSKALSFDQYSTDWASDGEIWLDDVTCTGNEPSLFDCKHSPLGDTDCEHYEDVFVNCSTVRLNGGMGAVGTSGLLEVYHNHKWGAVCSNGFTVQAAKVVCRQLGLQQLSTPELRDKSLPERLGRDENDPSLCGEESNVRFGWGFGAWFNNLVGLGNSSANIWLGGVSCVGKESSIFTCQNGTLGVHNCDAHKQVEVTCGTRPHPTGILRLKNGQGRSSGFLEVYHNGEWGTVCGKKFARQEATVLCRQLGFPLVVEYFTKAEFRNITGRIWFDRLSCDGTEHSLFDCRYSPLGNHNCTHVDDVYISCAAIRLSGGTRRSGFLELYYNGEWGTVCDNGFKIEEASVTCRQLGFPYAVSYHGYTGLGHGSGRISLSAVDCNGTESSLLDCKYETMDSPNCTHSRDVGISCGTQPPPLPGQPPLRLNGDTKASGLVEVYHEGEWGTMCEDGVTLRETDIICRQLGYQYTVSFYGRQAANRTAKIWFNNVRCTGREHSILDCAPGPFSSPSCKDGADLGVTCGIIRSHRGLIVEGGPNSRTGVFEMSLPDQSGAICVHRWMLAEAATACRQLGFDQAVASTCQVGSKTSRKISTFNNVTCTGNETSLLDCNYDQDINRQCRTGRFAAGVCGKESHGNEGIVEDVRLVGDASDRSGRVEVFVDSAWLGVRKERWTSREANVLCHQLGSYPEVATANYTWVNDIKCNGTESNITECNITTEAEWDYCSGAAASVICGMGNVSLELDSLDMPVLCVPEPHYTRSETATTSSAMDMIVLLDNPDSLVPFLHWMRDFIPWLDSELTVNGHGINSSCRNHFLLVGLDSNIYTRLLSSDKKIRTYPIEQFIAEFEAFEQGIPNNGLPDLRPDNYLAIPEVLQRVKLRDSKIKCLVSRAMIYATNSSQSSNDTSISVTRSKLHAQLRGTSTAFHTFSYRYNFCVSSNFSNIGHTSNTVFVNSHDGNCYHSMPNTTQFSDDVLENWLSHLALNVGGSAWDISPLCHLSATSCAFRDVIFQQMTKMLSSCFNCQCPISGQAICTPSNYTEDECKCAARGGNLQEGVCSFQEISSSPEKLPVSKILTSVSLAVVLCALLITTLLVRRCRRQGRYDTEASPKRTGQDENEERLPSLISAVHHMMAILAAPGSSKLKIIPNEALTFMQCIGKGQFGEVHLGLWHTRDSSNMEKKDVKVAIKILPSENTSDENSNALLEEYFLQEEIGEHPNIVKFLLGGLLRGHPCIVMEFMDGGDLQRFLRNIKGAQKLSGSSEPSLLDVEKLEISSQIAQGLEFMAAKNIVHRDIASRNILLHGHPQHRRKLTAKISDWGLSRKAIVDGAYHSQTTRKLPLKWMAIESIANGTFTEKTDVWSFGVLMWEIESVGETPYSGTPNALLLQYLLSDKRLERPKLCSNPVFHLMTRCWSENPDDRPKFRSIVKDLSQQLEESANYITVLDDINNSSPACAALKEPDAVLSPSVIPGILEVFRHEPVDIDREEDHTQQLSLLSTSRPVTEEDCCFDATQSEEKSTRYVRQLVKYRPDSASSPLHPSPIPSLHE